MTFSARCCATGSTGVNKMVPWPLICSSLEKVSKHRWFKMFRWSAQERALEATFEFGIKCFKEEMTNYVIRYI